MGAILTGFTVSGNGANNVSHEAIVIQSGKTPRLLLTANQGNDCERGSEWRYESSRIKQRIDGLSFSIKNHITNVSAPSIKEIEGAAGVYDDGTSTGYNYKGWVFLTELSYEEGNYGYWTRSGYKHGKSDVDIAYVSNNNRISWGDRYRTSGIRPAFNLKSDTVLKYSNGKFRITADLDDYKKAHQRKYGELYTKLDTALTTINNLQTSIINNNGPQILKISGWKGATCTTTTTFTVIVTTQGATEYRAKADTGGWTSWTPVDTSVTCTGITDKGAHTIIVEAKNAAGVTTAGQITIFKL